MSSICRSWAKGQRIRRWSGSQGLLISIHHDISLIVIWAFSCYLHILRYFGLTPQKMSIFIFSYRTNFSYNFSYYFCYWFLIIVNFIWVLYPIFMVMQRNILLPLQCVLWFSSESCWKDFVTYKTWPLYNIKKVDEVVHIQKLYFILWMCSLCHVLTNVFLITTISRLWEQITLWTFKLISLIYHTCFY